MIIKLNHSLAKLNSFGIDQQAERLLWAQSADEVLGYVKHHGPPALLLGGGSNLLLTKDIQGDVLQVDIQGRTVVQEDDDAVWVEFGAGENWNEAVLWTLEQGWGGLENLSLIPGNCGTAPVQNIGAYGVELKDVFVSCRGVHVERKAYFEIDHAEAAFGYRDSIFKNAWKNKAIITHITLKLSKHSHQIQGNYGSLKAKLSEMGMEDPTPQDISRAVIAIRTSKLPDPKVLGNSGSFFKNPVVSVEQANALKEKHPECSGVF